MLKKLPLTVFLLTCALFANAAAQIDGSPEKQAAVKELAAMINANNNAEEIYKQMSAQMSKMREQSVDGILEAYPNLSAAEKARVRTSILKGDTPNAKSFQERFFEKLNYSEMMLEITALIYDKFYTLDEVNDLILFYKSPTGQKTLKIMAPLAAETMKTVADRLIPRIPEILKEIETEDRRALEQKINEGKSKSKN